MSYEEKAIENAEANKTLQKLRSKMEEQRRQSAAKDQLGNKASSKFNMQIKVLEDNLETAKAELLTTRQDLEDRHHKKSEERAAAHSKDVKRLRESIESKERIVNQLSEVSERRGAEIESLQAVDALRGMNGSLELTLSFTFLRSRCYHWRSRTKRGSLTPPRFAHPPKPKPTPTLTPHACNGDNIRTVLLTFAPFGEQVRSSRKMSGSSKH
jgi:hypothetical protein